MQSALSSIGNTGSWIGNTLPDTGIPLIPVKKQISEDEETSLQLTKMFMDFRIGMITISAPAHPFAPSALGSVRKLYYKFECGGVCIIVKILECIINKKINV